MTLTRQDLEAIGQLLDEKLDQKLDEKLDAKLDEKLSGLKTDVAELKQDVGVLKQDVGILKQNVKRLELLVENNVLPRLDTIEKCYLDTFRRYQSKTDQIDTMQTDIDALKLVTKEHSAILARLA